jgi:putative transposase
VPPDFRRKNIRLPRDRYTGCNRYLITIVCADRKPLLLHDPARLVIQTLRNTARQFNFAIYSYCAMPDHLHFLAIGMDDDCNLLDFVMNFKRSCTLESSGRREPELWQKKFHDYILRDGASNGAVAQYILLNPVRKGLCTDPRQFEFAGSFTCDWPGVDDVAEWTPPWRR